MLENSIVALLAGQFANAEIQIKLEGNHCHVTVVSEVFEGLRKVKRQQMAYAALNEKIASGEIHAVYLNLMTPAEASA